MKTPEQLLQTIDACKAGYSLLPFWSWNDRLDEDELKRQIHEMHAAGIGGFFMHARGGLETEYLSDEWLHAIKVCIQEAKSLGMEPWLYDEDGWPSGFVGGAVPKKGPAYQQKTLLCQPRAAAVAKGARQLAGCIWPHGKQNGVGSGTTQEKQPDMAWAIYAVINPYYSDTLNPDAIEAFLQETHEVYRDKLGDALFHQAAGFFTDEPQLSNGAYPWSDTLPELFEARYGYSLTEQLPALFFPTEGCEAVRSDYWRLVNELFTEGFIGRMYRWCEENNTRLTGHVMSEQSLYDQMKATGGVMASYEYFHQPGMDWLGRSLPNALTTRQLASVCAQLGKQTSISEMYGLSGWDVTPEELRYMAEGHMVQGVQRVCAHLAAYSLRGARKRDFPPSLFTQLPWWQHFSWLANHCAANGAALSLGRQQAGVLVLHPMQSAYVLYDGTNNPALQVLDDELAGICRALDGMQQGWHFGDETLLRRYGRVEEDRVYIGECVYHTVLLPPLVNIASTTALLLRRFVENGGRLLFTQQLPGYVDGRPAKPLHGLATLWDGGPLCTGNLSVTQNGAPCEAVLCHERLLEDGSRLYFLLNKEQDVPRHCTIRLPAQNTVYRVDAAAGTSVALAGKTAQGWFTTELYFEVMGSALLFVPGETVEESAGEAPCVAPLPSALTLPIPTGKLYTVAHMDDNALTLDMCEWCVDGGPVQPETPVLFLQRTLLQGGRDCLVELRFSFKLEEGWMPDRLHLGIERPEVFAITLNGEPVAPADKGAYIDNSIRRLDILPYTRPGKNQLVLQTRFHQPHKLYKLLQKENVHESETNRLTFGTELESVYLLGSFSLACESGYRYRERNAITAGGSFTLAPAAKALSHGDFTTQGLWFFAGKLTLRQTLHCPAAKGRPVWLALGRLRAACVEVRLNGRAAGWILEHPHRLDVTDLVREGDNELELTLTSSCRNLFGPHHLRYGESYYVTVAEFEGSEGFDFDPARRDWCDDYTFVQFGFLGDTHDKA